MRIDKICEKYNITNYTINDDESIDVIGDVLLSNLELTELPIKFNKVYGKLNCSFNRLTTLKGSPIYVKGDFNCIRNKIESMEYCPKEVGGGFYIIYNNINSLENGPTKIGGDFCCDDFVSVPNWLEFEITEYDKHNAFITIYDYNKYNKHKNRTNIFKKILNNLSIFVI